MRQSDHRSHDLMSLINGNSFSAWVETTSNVALPKFKILRDLARRAFPGIKLHAEYTKLIERYDSALIKAMDNLGRSL